MAPSTEETDVVVIGGGLAGMSVGAALGKRAVVLERADRPGGLVRTENLGGWWFDHVLHLMYFPDQTSENLIKSLPMGNTLRRCEPKAWVQTAAGITAYPFQLNLGSLQPVVRDRCVADFIAAGESPMPQTSNYKQMLLATFGQTMCETFYFPYNRKMWRRPLEDLVPEGMTWNLTRPSLQEVVDGADGIDGRQAAYNRNGWYPRPAADAPVRGMEVVARGLAQCVADLRLGAAVVGIDSTRRVVHFSRDGKAGSLRYRKACVSSAPLPATVAMCDAAPSQLRTDCEHLPYNRVRSVAVSVVGPRPAGFGLWRYYADEDLPFTRLILMTSFDELMAPPNGWGLLAEVTERGDRPPIPTERLVSSVVEGVRRLGLLAESNVLATDVIENETAYVVFTSTARAAADRARTFLSTRNIYLVGRYGRWEYSSMVQVILDAIRLGGRL